MLSAALVTLPNVYWYVTNLQDNQLPLVLKVGTRKATCRCIGLCDKSLCLYSFQNKSLRQDACLVHCSDLPRKCTHAATTLLLLIFPRDKSHIFTLVWKKSVARTKIFTKILHVARSEVSLRPVPASCLRDLSPSVSRPCPSSV